MAKGSLLKAVLVEGGAVTSGSAPLQLALYKEDGTPLKLSEQLDALSVQAEPQADSEATTIKELVTDFNAHLANLRAAGLIAS